MKDFSDLYYVYRKDRQGIATALYIELMQKPERKNIEQMSKSVPDSDHQTLQQFITYSTWDAQAVMDRVAENVNELLGDSEHTSLIIDESEF
ncbi:MAG: transposase [Fibrobacter sp.]|mgnify:CR=1 FL=1|nr:transposase [Fibrobacter sp.]